MHSWIRAGTYSALLLTGMGCNTASRSEVSPSWAGWLSKPQASNDVKYEQPVEEVPSKLRDPVALSLAYALWMEELGNATEARKHFLDVIADQPDHAQATLGLARLDYRAGLIEEAEAGFKKALKIAPQDPDVLNDAAKFYLAENDAARGIALMRQVVAVAPHERAYKYRLAVVLAEHGDTEEAMKLFVQSVGAAEAHYNMGVLLAERGETAEAEEHLRTALQKRPDLQEARQWLKKLSTREEPPVQVADGSRSGNPAQMPKILKTGEQVSGDATKVTPQQAAWTGASSPRAPVAKSDPPRPPVPLTAAQREQLANQEALE